MHNPPPRIAPLEAPFDPAVAALLAERTPRRSPVGPLALFRTLVRDPALFAAMGAFGAFNLKFDPEHGSAIEPREREIVIDRVCARCRCEYEWGVHVASYAQRVGLTPGQVAATVTGDADDPVWNERERLLIAMVDALHDESRIPDALWAELAARWDERQLLQLLMLAGWYHAIAYVANAARVPLEDWAPRFPRSAAGNAAA